MTLCKINISGVLKLQLAISIFGLLHNILAHYFLKQLI